MENAIAKLMDFNESNLDNSLKNCGKLYAIALKKYKSSLYELNELEFKLSQIYAERYSYYKCDYEFQLANNEIKTFIENDLEYATIKKSIKDKEAEINVLEKHLKNIDSVRWDIKTLIEFMKLNKF